jgi:hypothetical protein
VSRSAADDADDADDGRAETDGNAETDDTNAGRSQNDGRAPTDPEQRVDELRTRVDELEAETRRLREQYAASRRQSYRRTALGLGATGAVAAALALVVPGARQVLFSVAAIGAFAAVLTWFLTPEHVIPASVGAAVYRPLAANEDSVTGELGLSATRVYLPTEDGGRLFVPEYDSYTLPADPAADTFVVGDTAETSGVSLRPSAQRLFEEFEASHTGPLPEAPDELCAHLAEGLTEGFELADGVETDVSAAENRATFEVRGCRFGPFSQFDHPVRSFLALGIARGLDAPATVEWETSGADDASLTVRWTDASDDGE